MPARATVPTATRGWFRIDPATCRVVAQGNITAERILLHARSLPVYGASPAPQNGTDNLCVAARDFVIAGRQCRGGQTAVPFTEIKPSTGEDGGAEKTQDHRKHKWTDRPY